ncbi:hypothetical protein Tco_0099420 [Tanacetum coccineum]
MATFIVGFISDLSAIKDNITLRVSNDDAAMAQRRLEDKQPEEKTNTDCLVKERKNVHLGIKVGANITVTGVPGQEGAEGGPRFEVPALDGDDEYRLCLSVTPKVEIVLVAGGGMGGSHNAHVPSEGKNLEQVLARRSNLIEATSKLATKPQGLANDRPIELLATPVTPSPAVEAFMAAKALSQGPLILTSA